MRYRRDPYIVFISAKTVAFAWIGAILFPFIVEMPLNHPMFWVCAASGALVVATFADGIKARRHNRMSDFVAKAVVPAILLVTAVVFVSLPR